MCALIFIVTWNTNNIVIHTTIKTENVFNISNNSVTAVAGATFGINVAGGSSVNNFVSVYNNFISYPYILRIV